MANKPKSSRGRSKKASAKAASATETDDVIEAPETGAQAHDDAAAAAATPRAPAVHAASADPAEGETAEDGEEAAKKQLSFSASRQFPNWLAEQKASLVFTTYQAGRVFFVGTREGGRVSLFERFFNRAMGLAVDGDKLWLASLFQLWKFTNSLQPGQTWGRGYDRLYVPRVGFTTGDIDLHDIGVDDKGRVIFVNTLFGCLATVSTDYSFQPLWKPPFISRLAAEDRCHLNGLAMDGGKARFVTAVGRTDVADGWREHRQSGGVVVDVQSGEMACTGLSMPHSPRVHNGTLYVLNSGQGEFGKVDLATGKFEPIAFIPGYLRGMSFINNFAVVATSKPRDGTFSGLALDDRLKKAGVEARCGISVIDLNTGDAVHWLRFDSIIEEMYDVAVLPGSTRPAALGFRTDEIRRVLSMPPGASGR